MRPSHTITRAAALIAGIAFVLSAVGCARTKVITIPDTRGERVLVEASADHPPDWVTREPESDREYHYFRGFRTDAPTLEDGETDARHNAMSHIVQFLGLRVEVDYERLRTEERTMIRDAIRSVGGADIFGARLSELYYRRWQINEGDRVESVYDVYVLIRFPREAIQRIRESQAARLDAIRGLIAGTGSTARPDELYSAILRASQALTAINDLNRNVLITTDTEAEAVQLRQQALGAVTRLIGTLHLKVATSTDRVVSGKQREPFVVTVDVSADLRAGELAVPNVPVEVALGDSVQTVWTNTEGRAVWSMPVVPLGVGSRQVIARVRLPAATQGIDDVARATPIAAVGVEVVPVTALTTLLVLLDEAPGTTAPARRPHLAEARLTEALKQAGFRVISIPTDSAYNLSADPWTSEAVAMALAERSGATALVRGTITTDTPTEVAMMPGVYFTRAEIRLSVTSVTDGDLVGSLVLPDDTLRDTRGFGNTPERAVSDALELDRSRQPNGYAYAATRIQQMLAR